MIIGISGKIGSGKDTVGKIIQYLTLLKWDNFNHLTNTFTNLLNSDNTNVTLYQHYISNAEEILKLVTNPEKEQKALFGKQLTVTSFWKIKKFAYKLKQCVSIITGIPVEDLEKEEVKRSRLPECWHQFDDNNHYVEPDTVRELLQKLGTEIGRNIHPNTWINALFSKYELIPNSNIKLTDTGHLAKSVKEAFDIMKPDNHNYPNWIITDCRFPNEAQAIKDRKGIIIRVNRPLNCNSCHMENVTSEDCLNCGYYPEYLETNSHPSETTLDDYKFDYTIDNNGTIEELIVKVKEILIKEKII